LLGAAVSDSALSVFTAMLPLGTSKAVFADVAVQSDAAQLAPQSNHSPWKRRALALSTVDTHTVRVAPVTVAPSGSALVSHCSSPSLIAKVPPLKLRLTPIAAAVGLH
jgi:hypothetical protein